MGRRTSQEEAFLGQADEFLSKARAITRSASSLPTETTWPLPATVIKDYRSITRDEANDLVQSYFAHGAAFFVVANSAGPAKTTHPLIDIAKQLADQLPLRNPLVHPLEGSETTLRHFGTNDGTLKVYDVKKTTGYIEQGETANQFDMHSDGLGSAGTVRAFVLYMETAPLDGGFLYLQDMLRLAVELAEQDPDAFRALFLPDALTVIRPTGKGALKVTGPALYLNDEARPQSFFRQASGMYTVTWRDDSELARARAFLENNCRPFAPGTRIIHMMIPGQGCIVDNERTVHGRTAFVNGPAQSQQRVLARKWFMRTAADAIYKHVPGLRIDWRYAPLYPETFGSEVLEGEWLYDAEADKNFRQK